MRSRQALLASAARANAEDRESRQRHEARAVNDHQHSAIAGRHPLADARPDAEQLAANETREDEFQRIRVEHHDEEEQTIENYRHAVFEWIPAKEKVVLVPNPADRREGHRKRRKRFERLAKIVEVLRHGGGDDEQRQHEAEDGVAEAFDA
jgi:hypothetical protein